MTENRASRSAALPSLLPLVSVGAASLLVYVAILWHSPAFAYPVPAVERPLTLVLGLFATAFVLYLFGLRSAVRVSTRYQSTVIWLFAIGFRVVLLVSEPIQEVDIYRYLWDGKVANAGVSPFAFAPANVLQAPENAGSQPELAKLVAVRDASIANRTILERVHFGELPTVYPPVSQIVFAAVSWATPPAASVDRQIIWMKGAILLFDLATMLAIAATLRYAGLHAGWLVSYAWCPLVLKEFANSGHLDAIAVFLTSMAVYFCCRAFHARSIGNQQCLEPSGGVVSESPVRSVKLTPSHVHARRAPLIEALLASVFLALAVGAKLYAVALIPITVYTSYKTLGMAKTISCGFVFALVTLASLYPLLGVNPTTGTQPWQPAGTVLGTDALSPDDVPVPGEQVDPIQVDFDAPFTPVPETTLLQQPPLPTGIPPTAAATPQRSITDRRAGLRAFLSHWMMNDFIFLSLSENFTSQRLRGDQPTPWFVVLPDSLSASIVGVAVRVLSVEEHRAPFAVARLLCGILFLGVAGYWAWRAAATTTTRGWLEYVFLSMAWFWLLLPTLNPWYWIWALPWIAFARNRVWLLLSGLLFVYYLRFYFEAHFANRQVVPWSPYTGAAFFDFVVVWIEYLPWFLALGLNRLWKRMQRHRCTAGDEVN